MEYRKYLRITAGLAVAGTLFSGYLSAIKLLTDTCAFNEPCPYFLGYPACWYGFGMFLAMAVTAFLGMAARLDERRAVRWLAGVSTAGTLFAGYFVAVEVLGWLSAGRFQGYGLVLPTCVYGLVFYVAILALTAPRLKRI